MAETTETTILNTTKRVAEAVKAHGNTGNWDIFIDDSGAGPNIYLANPDDVEDYRCIALDDKDQHGDDLSKYFWVFWTHDYKTWTETELGIEADDEAVLAKLAECLAEESRATESKA